MADKAVKDPVLGEIAAPEDPHNPISTAAAIASRVDGYTSVLSPSDTILTTRGSAENLNIYRELLRDDQVRATWQQRRLSLTSCHTVVEPGAQDARSVAAAEALQAEIDSLAWDDVTDKMLYAVFYGWAVAEIIWRPANGRVAFDRIVVRDRARFRFDRERNLYLSTSSGMARMPERKFWTIATGADHDDEFYGLGLAHSLYWPVFFKRNDVKFWLIFLEKFGMPTAVMRMPAAQIEDAEQRRKGIAVLRQIATDAGVLAPEGFPIELLEAARSGAADYAGMNAAMNAAISKIVVGQTMTTDSGSSLSQAQVHERVAESIMEADSDLLCSSFNSGPVKWWTEWNFPGATPPRVYRRTEPEDDLNARAERDKKISELGYEPTEEYIFKTYGEGWTKRQAPAIDVASLFSARQNAGGADPAQFAEGELAALAALKAARRADQQALVDAAVSFSEQYQTITGRRVGQILEAAEIAEDYETFRRRLDEILAEAPPDETVDKLARAGFFSRALGALRSQRRA